MNTAKTKPIEHDEITGEVLDTSVPALIETGMVATLVKAELDTQISTAKQYPRSLKGGSQHHVARHPGRADRR